MAPGAAPLLAQTSPPQLPVTARVLVDSVFQGAEGIAFNGEGRMFVTGSRSLWEVNRDGSVRHVTDLHSNLGLAAIGERDVLVADFGPTNALRHGPGNDDGVVWRVTPEGVKDTAVAGIGDPNAILVRADGSFLVSDDFTDKIYLVRDGRLSVFVEGIPYPNGLAISADRSTLYVAQIFSSIDPVEPNNQVWTVPLHDGHAYGPAQVLATTGERGANDGLALDEHGRLYVAANGDDTIGRINPATGEKTLIAEDVPAVASLAFGQGEWDRRTLYAVSTFRGGSRVWAVPVGVAGGPIYR